MSPSFIPPPMHGTYTHRITCNLYPDQYFKISHAARQFNSRVAPFLREIGLAYLDQRHLLPKSLESCLNQLLRELRRIGTNFNQIAARANTYNRLSHDDLRKGAQLITLFERQLKILRKVLETLPQPKDDREVDGA